MSAFDNVVGGKLKLKGKALDVKAGGVKIKKKQKKQYEQISEVTENEFSAGGCEEALIDPNKEEANEANKLTEDGSGANWDNNLTPAERCYMVDSRIWFGFFRFLEFKLSKFLGLMLGFNGADLVQ
ncbi:hypothetical protein Adt_14917 [Abeliophyllum distichum]|uniref:Uncharacterized protein n=1 Tax=Abeliophyllum distichum TaxID=126358 RepID=A0ABD1U103_9LAMI